VPAMFAGPVDAAGFYNPGGWGPAIIANFPPLMWFLVVGVVLIRRTLDGIDRGMPRARPGTA